MYPCAVWGARLVCVAATAAAAALVACTAAAGFVVGTGVTTVELRSLYDPHVPTEPPWNPMR